MMGTTSLLAVLFAYAPVMAMFGFAAAWIYRWGILRNDLGPDVPAISPTSEVALVVGFFTVVGGHCVTVIAPDAMRALLGDLSRVALIELVGLVGALLFSWGLLSRLRVRLQIWRSGGREQLPRVAILGLFFLVSCTGALLTVQYRWLTAWYAYVSVPYLRSLFVLDPVTDAMTASPWPVQLHVVLLLLLGAAWPMAGLSLSEICPLRRVAERLTQLGLVSKAHKEQSP
jgi:nitrate reductase gamma subunit